MEWITRLLMRAYEWLHEWLELNQAISNHDHSNFFFRIKLSLASKNIILTVQ